jgi:pimeloyl-ACP methyl ester carboxylesterase
MTGVERAVDIDGERTAYWQYGAEDAGTVVVLVHGFRGDHHGLEPVAARLAVAENVRVLAPDLPGFGISAPFRGHPHDIGGYATWLRRFLAATVGGSGARFVLLGHSFGSIVVSAMMAGAGSPLEHPEPDQVVLVNPIGAPALSGPRAVFTRLAIFYYWLADALPQRLGFALLRNAGIVRIMSEAMAKTHDRALRGWIHDQHARYFSAFANREVVLEAFMASVSHDVSEYAAAIATPTLLIAADGDDITPLSTQHRLRGLFPDARLHVIEGVGHLVHYEAPEEAAREVLGFIGAQTA